MARRRRACDGAGNVCLRHELGWVRLANIMFVFFINVLEGTFREGREHEARR